MQHATRCLSVKYNEKGDNVMVKNYKKPEIEIQTIVSDKNISNLGTWLDSHGVSEDVSIVTYTFAVES